jgi:hypothetical protein
MFKNKPRPWHFLGTVLSVIGIFHTMPHTASANAASTGVLTYSDAWHNVSSTSSQFISTPSNFGARIAHGKVVLYNGSTGTRRVECKMLTYGSADYSDVQLAPGAYDTINLMVMYNGSQSSAVLTNISCYTFGGATDGVQAGWIKVSEIFLSSATASAY